SLLSFLSRLALFSTLFPTPFLPSFLLFSFLRMMSFCCSLCFIATINVLSDYYCCKQCSSFPYSPRLPYPLFRGRKGNNDGEFGFPFNVFVAEKRKNCIQVFDLTSSRFLHRWDDVISPSGLCVSNDRLYIASARCIFAISPQDGTLSTLFGRK